MNESVKYSGEKLAEASFTALVDEIGTKLKEIDPTLEEYNQCYFRWQEGELSSLAFLPHILGRIFKSNIRVSEENLHLPSTRPETIWPKVTTNPRVKEDFLLGFNGQNPPCEEFPRFFSFLKNFRPRFTQGGKDLTDLKTGELRGIDGQLPPSLFAHMWIFTWMGRQYKGRKGIDENVVFSHYRNAVKEALKTQELEIINPWLRWMCAS